MAAAGTFIDPLIIAITDGNLGMVNTLLDNPEIDINNRSSTKEGSEDAKDFKTPLKHAIDEYISDKTDIRFNRLEIVKNLVLKKAVMDEDENKEIKRKYDKNEYDEEYYRLQTILFTYFTSQQYFFKMNKDKFGEENHITRNIMGRSGGLSPGLPKPDIPPSTDRSRHDDGMLDVSPDEDEGAANMLLGLGGGQMNYLSDLSGGRGKIKKKTRKSKRSKRSKTKRSKRSRRSKKK